MSEECYVASAACSFLPENFGGYTDAVEMAVGNEDLMTEYCLFKLSWKCIEIVTVSGNHIDGDLNPASDVVFTAFHITAVNEALCIRMHLQDFMQIFVVSVSITHNYCFIQSNNSAFIFLKALPL